MRWLKNLISPEPKKPVDVKPLKKAFDPPEDPPPMPEENKLKPNWDRDGRFIGWGR